MKNKYDTLHKPFIPHAEAEELFVPKPRSVSEAEALIHQITLYLSIGQVDDASEHVAELFEACFRYSASLKSWSPTVKSRVWTAFKQAVANQL